MNNKTIVHIANFAAPYKGNFIKSLEILEDRLNHGGRTVYIFPKTCLNVKWINDFLLEHKVYFVDSPKKKFYVFYDKKLINDLKKIFEKEHPDIIHSHFDGYDEYCVKANICNAKIIWRAHNTRSLVQNKIKRLYQHMDFYHQYVVVGKNVSIIIPHKEFKNFLDRYKFSGKTFYLPNGIDERRISFNVKEKDDTINFLTFGGRAEHKGIDLLCESIKRVSKMDLSYKLVFNITEGSDTLDHLNQYFDHNIPKEVNLIKQTEDINSLFKK